MLRYIIWPLLRSRCQAPGTLASMCTLAAVSLFGCGGTGAARDVSGAFPSADERRRHAIEYNEIVSSDSSLSLTRITGIDVDSQGRIYVGDWYQQRITVLGPDGELIRAFGRRGSGPGEFRSIRGVQVLPGDSLLVYDPTLARISVFAPDSTRPAYVTNLAARIPGEAPFHIWRTRANDGYVALFRPGFMFREGRSDARREDVIRVLDLDGAPRGDRLLVFPSKSFLVASESITPNPFGREGLVRIDSRDRLHYLWTDSLRIETLDLSGREIGGFSILYDSPRVSVREVEGELAAFNGQVRATFDRVLRDSVPERWPAARDVVVDDEDRIWIALGGARGKPTEWAVFSAAGTYLGSTLVPTGVTVWAIRAGNVYAERSDNLDVPHVIVLRLARLPQ